MGLVAKRRLDRDSQLECRQDNLQYAQDNGKATNDDNRPEVEGPLRVSAVLKDLSPCSGLLQNNVSL